MVLMTATVLALPAFASAQTEKIVFYSQRDAAGQIWAMNPDGSNPTNLSNNDYLDYMPDASATGAKIAFISNRDGGDYEIYAMNGDGTNQTRLTVHAGWDFQPTISGDGSRVAFVSDRDGNNEIYVVNSDGTNLIRLTDNAAADEFPAFSEDGSKILFTSWRDGDSEIYVMNADGSNQTRLTDSPGLDEFAEFNAAGNKIVFHSYRSFNGPDIYVMDADGKNQVNVTNSYQSELYPTFSPDGSRIAFSTERDGGWEVYAMNADGTNVVNLTNNPVEDLFGSWTSGGGPIGPPTDINQCKKGGWKIFNSPRTFANQGDCIDFVNNGGDVSAFRTETEAATSASQHTGGVNVLMGDGSVRFISQSVDVQVWRIYLPNSPLEYDYVDAADPNAENKARALFDAAYRMRRGIVVSVEQGTPVIPGKVSMAKILINDGSDRRYLEIKLEECLISGYSTSGSSGNAAPLEALQLNFQAIKFEYKPNK